MSLQDVLWFFLIVKAGGYGIADTLGFKLLAEKVKKNVERQVENRSGDPARQEKTIERQ